MAFANMSRNFLIPVWRRETETQANKIKHVSLLFTVTFGDAFRLGTDQIYNYENEVTMGSNRFADKTLGYKITAGVRMGVVWERDNDKLFRFQVNLNIFPLLSPTYYYPLFRLWLQNYT
jgi:hypothetical protein